MIRRGARPSPFKTHRYLQRGEVLLLLGGVHTDYRRLASASSNTFAELAELRRLGMTGGITHISAANYQVFNSRSVGLDFAS